MSVIFNKFFSRKSNLISSVEIAEKYFQFMMGKLNDLLISSEMILFLLIK